MINKYWSPWLQVIIVNNIMSMVVFYIDELCDVHSQVKLSFITVLFFDFSLNLDHQSFTYISERPSFFIRRIIEYIYVKSFSPIFFLHFYRRLFAPLLRGEIYSS